MGRLDKAHETERNRTPEQAFGFTLRTIRRKQGRSQQWLADKSGYHRTYIGLLEHGHKSPSLRTIFNVAATLEMLPSEILEQAERLLGRIQRRRGGKD